MNLKEVVNRNVDVSMVLGTLLNEMTDLQESGKLNVVDLVQYIKKTDEYSAIQDCIRSLGNVLDKHEGLEKRYKMLVNYVATYKHPLPYKLEQFYNRLENNLERYSQEKFVFQDLMKWERLYYRESTLKRHLKRLIDWGYVGLHKKDKRTGYQYKLRFKKGVNYLID